MDQRAQSSGELLQDSPASVWPRSAVLSNAGKSSKRYLRFSLAVAAVAVIWTVVLPWVATQPQMAEHLQELDRQGIDGGAMFYTELKAMEPILHKLESPLR